MNGKTPKSAIAFHFLYGIDGMAIGTSKIAPMIYVRFTRQRSTSG